MRLPWPFGRRTPSDGPSPAAPEGASPSAPSAPRDLTAPPTGAWTSLPPIQRTMGDAPLVAPSAAFLDEVPGHRPLPPIVQALGHETGPSAPPGLVVAKPSAVPSLTSRVPMPVQRRAAASPGEVPEAWSERWSEPESPVDGPPPVRELQAIAPSATVTPAPLPLTQAPAVATPVAQRSGAGAPRPSSRGAPSPAGASSPGVAYSPALAGPTRHGSLATRPLGGAPDEPRSDARPRGAAAVSHARGRLPGHAGPRAHVLTCLNGATTHRRRTSGRSRRERGLVPSDRGRTATRGSGQPDDVGTGHLGQPTPADDPGAGAAVARDR